METDFENLPAWYRRATVEAATGSTPTTWFFRPDDEGALVYRVYFGPIADPPPPMAEIIRFPDEVELALMGRGALTPPF
jgi:hypothetical protein